MLNDPEINPYWSDAVPFECVLHVTYLLIFLIRKIGLKNINTLWPCSFLQYHVPHFSLLYIERLQRLAYQLRPQLPQPTNDETAFPLDDYDRLNLRIVNQSYHLTIEITPGYLSKALHCSDNFASVAENFDPFLLGYWSFLHEYLFRLVKIVSASGRTRFLSNEYDTLVDAYISKTKSPFIFERVGLPVDFVDFLVDATFERLIELHLHASDVYAPFLDQFIATCTRIPRMSTYFKFYFPSLFKALACVSKFSQYVAASDDFYECVLAIFLADVKPYFACMKHYVLPESPALFATSCCVYIWKLELSKATNADANLTKGVSYKAVGKVLEPFITRRESYEDHAKVLLANSASLTLAYLKRIYFEKYVLDVKGTLKYLCDRYPGYKYLLGTMSIKERYLCLFHYLGKQKADEPPMLQSLQNAVDNMVFFSLSTNFFLLQLFEAACQLKFPVRQGLAYGQILAILGPIIRSCSKLSTVSNSDLYKLVNFLVASKTAAYLMIANKYTMTPIPICTLETFDKGIKPFFKFITSLQNGSREEIRNQFIAHAQSRP